MKNNKNLNYLLSYIVEDLYEYLVFFKFNKKTEFILYTIKKAN